jgi:23S rRNA (uracil1939-C5)-methyltransferase
MADGRVVFVERGAPGDLVEVSVDERSTPRRGRIVRVLELGVGRVEPSCPRVSACGGCDWMHLSVPAQEQAHAAIVSSALAHATDQADLPSVRVHAAPEPLGYRTRARLFLRAEREGVQIGYRAEGSHKLVSIESCAVLAPAIAPALAELPEALQGSHGYGDALVALGEGGRRVVELEWRGELSSRAFSALDRKVTEGLWAGARVRLEGVTAPATFGDPRIWMEGADGAPLVFAPGAFAQPSRMGAHLLAHRTAALAQPGAARPKRVVELFAGSGTLSVLLAQGAASFLGVESNPEAVEAARQNLASRKLAGKMVVHDAETMPIPRGTEIVVLDPPRTGARGASHAIAASRARAVVYVSCDPPTLARDLAIFTQAGWLITDIETLELFPQTSHVETLVRLVRRDDPG